MSKALQLSKNDVQALVKRAESLQKRVEKVKEKADTVVETGVRSAIVAGTAFACGVAQGKFGGIEVLGVPGELLLGVGGHLAGFMGLGGSKTNGVLHSVADGALAAWAATMGRGVGDSWGGKIAGSTSGDSLTEDEMERIAKAQKQSQ